MGHFKTSPSSSVRPPAFPPPKHPLEEKCLYSIFLIQIPNFLETSSIWKHLEGPGCKKWCHSQPKSTFHVKSIKKASVFEGDIDFDRFPRIT